VGKRKPSFRRRDGVLGIPRIMVRSPAYRDLPALARAAIIELQDVYRGGAVHMSTRRLAERLGVDQSTAARSLTALLESGFLEVLSESDRLGRRAREYRLTWMPFEGREAGDEYLFQSSKN